MLLPLCRIVARKLLVRKGRLIVALFLFLLGVLGTFYFRTESKALLVDGPARTIRVPSLESRVVINKSASQSVLHHRNKQLPSNDSAEVVLAATTDSRVFHVGRVPAEAEEESVPGMAIGPRVFPSDTAECITPALQPATGQFSVQMSSLMDKLPYDNINGGVWKQGYDLTYSMEEFKEDHLQVFVVPHSHNDPGWLKTFEEYYKRQTRNILTLMTNALAEDSRKKFIWAEISYLHLWWREQNDFMKDRFKRLVANGQLEIVTGGWVMNDEANTHYFAMVDQLVEGHLWLQQHLPGVVPKSGWAIDPFGYSPTMTYLLHQVGMEAMVIQRGHYHIKKHLAREKELEFRWVQEWDRGYDSSVLCHLTPFYIYDIPHTCGPDPKVCCQFDFNRLPGSKVNCPWKVRPTAITDQNVRERAELLADQYRKKSTLFKTNAVLVPLGDDFRWDTSKEINAQFTNYFKLMDYMNSHPEMKINIQFGTLNDYFKAVKKSLSKSISTNGTQDVLDTLPTLAGDFFTYADRDDHYWSGYFTSRPFHKHMDRVLSSDLRMAEILYSVAMAKGLPLSASIPEMLTEARRNLGLFQHHDAITGTAKDLVVNDYSNKMVAAITKSKSVSQDALKALLSSEYSDKQHVRTMTFTPEETYPSIKTLPNVAVIDVSNGKSSIVTFVNSLTHRRVMLVSVVVNSPDIMVADDKGKVMLCQISPVLYGEAPASDKFLAVFEVSLPPLGVTHYRVTGTGSQTDKNTVRAKVQYINMQPPARGGLAFQMEGYESTDFVLSTHYNVSATFSGQTGLLKSMSVGPSEVALDVDFVMYGSRRGRDRSGAYLFLPDRDGMSMIANTKPHVILAVGPLVQEVTSFLPQVKHSVVLSSSHGLDGRSLSIHNTVDIRSYSTNKEVAMRIRSSVDSGSTFYTDMNGFQLTRRKTYNKLPLQGNFYPMPSMAILQDANHRLSLCSRQPLGVASLKPGWLEVMLDRKLLQDDNRGLGQGVKDSVVTFEPFKLLVERRLSNLKPAPALVYPSLLAQYTMDSLLHPPSTFISSGAPPSSPLLAPLSFLQKSLPCDFFLLNLRSIFEAKQKATDAILTLHRRGFDCGFDMASLKCEVKGGEIRLGRVFKDITISEATETSLSLFQSGAQLELKKELSSHIDIMHIQAYRIAW